MLRGINHRLSRSRWRLPKALIACVLVAACSSTSPTTSPAARSATIQRPDVSASPARTRLGRYELLAPSGGLFGHFSATRESDAATRLSVDIQTADASPWGIFDQSACGAPRADHDAPFQFADIEGGSRTELVETPAYLGFPTNLVVLVFGADGGTVAGCADLGPAHVALASPGPTESCDGPARSVDAGAAAGTIAFSSDALSNTDIYLMDPDGSNVRRLTAALGVDMKPSWSPNGSEIAFRSSRDGQDEIYVMAADGTCQRNLTMDPRDDRSPAWSPDGCAIAYDHFFDERFQDIAVIGPAGGQPRRVTTRSGEYPSWSPDGKRIAFASARDGDYDIYIINADGSGERQVANVAGYQFYPTWSPDGKWLAYESGPSPIDGLQIHVMRPDGTDDRAVTRDTATNRFPAWSPDGGLMWSASGTIVWAASPGEPVVSLGVGQFPAARPDPDGGAAC